MIIRKPYAFLVKHYKIIHLLMILPILYLIYKSFNMMQFFSSFVSNGYLTKEINIASIYYSFLMPLLALIVVIISSLIYSLLKSKNKSYGIYLMTIVFYLAFFFFSLFLKGVLNSFETTDIDSSVALMYQGITSIAFYIQPLIIILLGLSAFGFNFRTFEFIDILDEISVDEADSEEVEINVGIEDYKIKRGLRKYFRELKYYVIENKVIFTTIGIILGVILAIVITLWVISLNRIVRVDQSFTHSKFSITFNDALLSTYDYNGNIISNDKIYLAVKTTVKNNTKGLLTLDTDDFWLEIGNKYYYPVLDRSGKFIDLAKPYYGEKIGAGESNEYVLVYELDGDEAQVNYNIKVLDSITYKEKEIIPKYKEITIDPTTSFNIVDNGTVEKGTTLNFNKTTLLNSSLLINDYSISKIFQYTYQYCYNSKCSDSKNSITADANSTLLVLNGNINVDQNSSYYKYKLSNNNFAQDFMKIEYTIGDKTSYLDVKDSTPNDSTGFIVLETSNYLKNADSISLIITIRNQKYTYKLK